MRDSPMEDAKSYISSRQIPQLFESLMTGLMFHRPSDHLEFIIDCVQKVQHSGKQTVQWDSFVDLKRGNTLPPISNSTSNTKSESPTADFNDINQDEHTISPKKKTTPLPPIIHKEESVIQKEDKNDNSSSSAVTTKVPSQIPVVLVMGGPGSGKLTQSKKVVEKYKQKNWTIISINDLLRKKIVKHGSAEEKWRLVGELLRKGEIEPKEIADGVLKEVLSKSVNSGGFLILGYPKTVDQMDELNRNVGHVDLAIMIDCQEQICQTRLQARKASENRIDDNDYAILRRIEYFKTRTVQVAQYFEQQGKLVTISGDRDIDEVFYDITNILDVAFYGKKPDSVVIHPSASPQVAPKVSPSPRLLTLHSFILNSSDKGRKPGLPVAPIIFIMGGPGCGKGIHCQRLVGRFPNFVHLSIGDILRDQIELHGTSDEKWSMILEIISNGEMAPQEIATQQLITNIKKNQAAKGFIIEGYLRDKNQLDDFFTQIGGMTLAILLDCDERSLYKNVEKRRELSGRIDDNPSALKKRIEFYKTYTLPVAKYLDDHGKLSVVAADRSLEDVHYDLASIFNYILYKNLQNTPNLQAGRSSAEEAVEEEISPVKAYTTGARETTMADISKKHVIFVVGGPGCGKGTQCAKIVEKYGYCHLSSGDLLREEVASGSPLGNELNAIMQSGALVPLEKVLTLLKEAMLKNPQAKGFLIDGYPRELEQGVRFEKEIKAPSAVLYFEVPDDVMVERLLGRAKTSGRVDDNEETIKKRLKTFHDHSDAVLDHYQTKNLLCKIDARGQVDDIFGHVVQKLDSLN